MNLILAVVVDRAMDEREASKEKQIKESKIASQERKVRLLNIISEFDLDKSGTLSRKEISEACASSEELRMILDMADVHHEELQLILDSLEAESPNGEIGYIQFCEVIH